MRFKNSSVERAHSTAKMYLNSLEEYGAAIETARANYKGEALAAKLSELQEAHATTKESAFSILEACKADMCAALDGISADSLDGKKITPDYELLRLPVTLTEDEIMTLNRRNADNPLFIRALREYCHSRDIPTDSIVDTFADRRTAVDELIKHTADIIRNDNQDAFSDLDAMGAYERLDSRIQGAAT